MAVSDQPGIIRENLQDGWRRLKRRVRGGTSSSFKLAKRAPERIMMAPQDLRTPDPTLAQEFSSGIFSFAGSSIETGGKSPFQLCAPNETWERQLHTFRWLRHFQSLDNALSHASARALVNDWINDNEKTDSSIAWDIEITAKRLIAWFCHSIVLMDGADQDFYRLLMRSMAQHIRYLRHRSMDAPDGMPRLLARVALSYAAVCLSDQKLPLRNAHKNLDEELQAQILPDGGHISRNCWACVEILADLLPLRQACFKHGQGPSTELIASIERMFPFIKMMRHSDGAMARFNGTAFTSQDLLTTILRYDETMAAAPREANDSGYQRLSGGDTTVLADFGDTGLGEVSVTGHAGCFAFEMSSGRSPIVINCGTPIFIGPMEKRVWRTTAAHSTGILNNTSSSRFHISGSSDTLLKGRILSGPRKVVPQRIVNTDGEQITAHHDAYIREFGIRHRRMLGISKDGSVVMGSDTFTDAKGNTAKYSTRDNVDLRFHLHPTVSTLTSDNENVLIIETNSGERWHFTCIDTDIVVEESIYFSSPIGPEPTTQIALHFHASEVSEVRWIFEKQPR